MSTLYIVATPIGNLKDITIRAVEVLKFADLIVCEDTRVFGKLAKEYQIEKRLLAVNDFNERSKVASVISELKKGTDVALVSDAGTPLISDPGFKLVREAIAEGIKVESVPGPTSVIAALTVSGFPTDKFLFLGYLPKKDQKRKSFLANLSTVLQNMADKHFRPTVIFYESPYRLVKTFIAIKEIFGDIDVVICRELTKMHEEVRREKISLSIEHFSKVTPRGELVILFVASGYRLGNTVV